MFIYPTGMLRMTCLYFEWVGNMTIGLSETKKNMVMLVEASFFCLANCYVEIPIVLDIQSG
jgi:hypothetical protein